MFESLKLHMDTNNEVRLDCQHFQKLVGMNISRTVV